MAPARAIPFVFVCATPWHSSTPVAQDSPPLLPPLMVVVFFVTQASPVPPGSPLWFERINPALPYGSLTLLCFLLKTSTSPGRSLAICCRRAAFDSAERADPSVAQSVIASTSQEGENWPSRQVGLEGRRALTENPGAAQGVCTAQGVYLLPWPNLGFARGQQRGQKRFPEQHRGTCTAFDRCSRVSPTFGRLIPTVARTPCNLKTRLAAA